MQNISFKSLNREHTCQLRFCVKSFFEPEKPFITQTMTKESKLEDPDCMLVKELQVCLIWSYCRVPNLLAEG